jgi:hypothetical protein
MARGSSARLRRYASKAFNKVASNRYGMKCGTSSRGSKPRVCLATHPVPDMKCGRNPINKLYACARPGARKRRRRRG